MARPTWSSERRTRSSPTRHANSSRTPRLAILPNANWPTDPVDAALHSWAALAACQAMSPGAPRRDTPQPSVSAASRCDPRSGRTHWLLAHCRCASRPASHPTPASTTPGLELRGDGTCQPRLPRDTLQGQGWLGHAYHDRAGQVPAGRRRGPIGFLPACNQAPVAARPDPLGQASCKPQLED